MNFGSYGKLTEMVTGAKTVTTVAAEIFASNAALDGRYAISIYNVSNSIIYIGKVGVTVATGYPINPGESLAISLNPGVYKPLYCIASASSVVRVVELA